MNMRKCNKYFLGIVFCWIIFFVYINHNIYYVKSAGIYVKVLKEGDTCILYLSKSKLFGGDYIRYIPPQSTEIANLDIYEIEDTLYAVKEWVDFIDIHSKDLNIKPVYRMHGDGLKEDLVYWTDSTIFKEKRRAFCVNHRHGVFEYK